MANEKQRQKPPQLDDGVEDARVELDGVLNALASVLIQIDSHLVIQRWNPAAERVLGLAAQDVIGRPLTDCGVDWKEEDVRRLEADLAVGTASPRLELGFVDGDGQHRCLGVGLSPIETDSANRSRTLIIGRDITKSQRAEELQRRLITAVEQVDDTIVITDLNGTIIYANPAFERVSGYTLEEAIGLEPNVLNSGQHPDEFYEDLWDTLSRGEVWSGHFTNQKKDGTIYEEDATISPVRDDEGTVVNYVAVKKDVTEKTSLEIQLRTAQKLESIGQLAAGIAHEINTPTQYISDNTRFLRDAFEKIGEVLSICAEVSMAGGEAEDPAATLKNISKVAQGANIDFIREEIPGAIEESLIGLARVSEIVSAMKSFSHPGTDDKQPIDLNEAITTTVTLSTNEWKYVSDVETELDPELPMVDCLPGEMGQVLLNIIVNAAHAIAETTGGHSGVKGVITIKTRAVGDQAEIRISDSGCGMPEHVKVRIFDPFYTTKEVGRGTGQGLAISHSVIVDKHNGSIEVESKPGEGTTFIVRIPLRAIQATEEAA